MVDQRAEGTADREWIDKSTVTSAFLSDEFWAYSLMVYALGQGPSHLCHFARTCPCHHGYASKVGRGGHGGGQPQPTGVFEFLLQKAEESRCAQHRCCIGKGLQAPAFAVGKHREIMATTYDQLGSLLLLEFANLGGEGLHRVMSDWDRGRSHILYEIQLKMSTYQQLPLVLCSLGFKDHDLGLTVHTLLAARSAYDESSTDARHLAITHAVLGPGQVRTDLDIFLASGGLHETALLKQWRHKLSLIRCDEISVESMHRQGSLMARGAHHHDAPYLSFGLRSPECYVQGQWDLASWADQCARVDTDFKIMSEFQLESHPTWVAWQHEQLVQNKPITQTGRHGSHRASRHLFYRCDQITMFNAQSAIAKLIDKATALRKRASEQAEPDPLNDAAKKARSTGTAKDSFELVLLKYAYAHFRDNVKAGDIYMVPREPFQSLVPLTHTVTMCGQKRRASAIEITDSGLQDDSIDMSHMVLDRRRGLCFEVIATHPKRRKMVNGAGLRSDQMAILQYTVDASARANDQSTGVFNVSSRLGTTSAGCGIDDKAIELLGIEAFLAVGDMQRLKSSTFKCSLQQTSMFHFSGRPLAPVCHSMPAWGLVTSLVQSGAYPGQGSSWLAPQSLSQQDHVILEELCQEGLVIQCARDRFVISDNGMQWLRRSRPTMDHSRMFKRSRHMAIGDMSTWQLVDVLLELGWQAEPQPRGKTVAVTLAPGVDQVAKFYFNSKLEISRWYLLCLCQTRALGDKGVPELLHKQKAQYYTFMLKHLVANIQFAPMLMDDSAADRLPLPSPESTPLALQNGNVDDATAGDGASTSSEEQGRFEEGDPDDSDLDPEAAAPDPSDHVAGNSWSYARENFRPFLLKVRQTVQAKTGNPVFQLTCVCPFHRDLADPPGTRCTKALGYANDEERALTRLRLREWCLAGRTQTMRAGYDESDHGNAHKHVDPMQLPLRSEAEQDAALATALQESSWIFHDRCTADEPLAPAAGGPLVS